MEDICAGIFYWILILFAIFCGIVALIPGTAGIVIAIIVIVAIIVGSSYLFIRLQAKKDKELKKKKTDASNAATAFFDKLCQKYILIGTDAYMSHIDIGIIGMFCKKYSTAILMPGVQFNELESTEVIPEWYLKHIADLTRKGEIKIEGMNYSPTQVSRTDTIDALVKFAEKAIKENTSFVYITDDPALLVRINCLPNNANLIEIHSTGEIESMAKKYNGYDF